MNAADRLKEFSLRRFLNSPWMTQLEGFSLSAVSILPVRLIRIRSSIVSISWAS